MYNIDFEKLILWLLPDFWRKPRHYAWLLALCKPVIWLHECFLKQRKANLYRVNHSGQVFSLQKVLNDRFDQVERRIYIADGFSYNRLYIYTRQEDKPKYLKLFLRNRSDYADTGVDFLVWVPTGVFISPSETYEMRALIDFYKLAGKRYRIYRI